MSLCFTEKLKFYVGYSTQFKFIRVEILSTLF